MISSAVDRQAQIYMAVFVVLGFPAAAFVDRQGLKCGVLVASLFNFVGAFLRIFPFFSVVFIGQSVAALAQALFFALPPLLAETWWVVIACSDR